MDKYRIPAVIAITADLPAPTDVILAAFELQGITVDPSSIRVLSEWEKTGIEVERGVGATAMTYDRVEAMYEVDVCGSKDVLPILMGELIDFTRGVVDFTQVDYS